nr:MAG TPA_asm: hypothetical protein [Caudoviricetes sp.]
MHRAAPLRSLAQLIGGGSAALPCRSGVGVVLLSTPIYYHKFMDFARVFYKSIVIWRIAQ